MKILKKNFFNFFKKNKKKVEIEPKIDLEKKYREIHADVQKKMKPLPPKMDDKLTVFLEPEGLLFYSFIPHA